MKKKELLKMAMGIIKPNTTFILIYPGGKPFELRTQNILAHNSETGVSKELLINILKNLCGNKVAFETFDREREAKIMNDVSKIFDIPTYAYRVYRIAGDSYAEAVDLDNMLQPI